jgi:hypothetical protein
LGLFAVAAEADIGSRLKTNPSTAKPYVRKRRVGETGWMP